MQGATTALVLGGGGMFGAYEVGVWKALEGVFQPDMIVGASIGALNGWAIAGGCPADDWIAEWLSLGVRGQLRMRVPSGVFDGLYDSEPMQAYVRELTLRFQPRVRFGAVLLSLSRLKTQVFWDAAVTWRHLCASCGVPILLKQYQIDGRLWADGGLLSAVPLASRHRRGRHPHRGSQRHARSPAGRFAGGPRPVARRRSLSLTTGTGRRRSASD